MSVRLVPHLRRALAELARPVLKSLASYEGRAQRVLDVPLLGRFAIAIYRGAGNVHRSRHALNADTIREMHAAFRQGGREAIDKVMRTQPAVFLKLLVLLVPREMKVEHKGGVKAMTDEELERGIEMLTAAIQARADSLADNAKVVEGVAQPIEALPAPDVVPDDKPMRSNKVMDAADTALGPRERKPKKGKVPSPAGT
jgi:hypothetical protein